MNQQTKRAGFSSVSWESVGTSSSSGFSRSGFEGSSSSSGFQRFGSHQQAGVPEPLENAMSEETAEKLEEVRQHQRLKEEYERGRKAGIEEGLDQAMVEIIDNSQKQIAHLAAMTREFVVKSQEVLRTAEVEAVKFALEVSRHILISTSDVRPEYIVDVVREGIRSLGAGTPTRVRISEQDYEFMQVVGLPPEISEEELGVKYVVDPLIKTGCVIETNFGEIDLQLESMWEQVKDKIYGSF